jgi:hypothetical protein
MVDNVAITAGTGTTIAADDIGAGVLVQRVKATWGPDGTANDTDVATGKPMPVQLRSSTGTAITPITPDVGSGTGGSATQRVIVDSSQLALNNTTAQAMAAGFQLTDPPTDGTFALRTGSLTETAPATDTASSGVNGRLQRIAQRITSMIALLPTALGGSGGLKVDDIFSQYETVAASATAQALGATGATGDYLAGVLVFPGTAGCGVVTVLDNATTIGTFAGGGTTALPSLVPFMIPVGLYSVSGAWKITTGANVTAVGIGKFT